MELENVGQRVALITGASRGLGYSVAIELSKQGIHILALSRTIGALEELAGEVQENNGTITLIPLDITDEKGLQGMSHSMFERWGKLDILIHGVGTSPPLSPVITISTKDFDRVISVNTKSTQRIISMMDPLLKLSKDGVAIFVDDDRDNNAKKFLGAYLASKAAARELIQSYCLESKRIGPKVFIFKPQPMPTALRKRFYPGEKSLGLSSCQKEAKKLLNLISFVKS